jgi:hypothetical protein
MIIHNLNVFSACVRPTETEAELRSSSAEAAFHLTEPEKGIAQGKE